MKADREMFLESREWFMACDGFEHGMRIIAKEDFLLGNLKIKKWSEGVIDKVHHGEHLIDVQFRDFGLIRRLPAHKFGVAALA